MSDKVTREEMLEIIDGICLECKDGGKCPNEYCRGVLKAIRALIEQGPEVSREFVEKWERQLLHNIRHELFSPYGAKPFLTLMLTEAGVTVREEK